MNKVNVEVIEKVIATMEEDISRTKPKFLVLSDETRTYAEDIKHMLQEIVDNAK